jgi:hypothetical protein
LTAEEGNFAETHSIRHSGNPGLPKVIATEGNTYEGGQSASVYKINPVAIITASEDALSRYYLKRFEQSFKAC